MVKHPTVVSNLTPVKPDSAYSIGRRPRTVPLGTSEMRTATSRRERFGRKHVRDTTPTG